MALVHAQRICLTGAESSGKSTLAQALAERLDASLVPEQARSYLDEHGLNYEASDLLEIARRQHAAEEAACRRGGRVICDTDVLVIAIWWRERFGPLPTEIADLMAHRTPRHYLLTRPDIPWQPDPQRENPTDRQRLHHRYHTELAAGRFPWIELSGSHDSRLRTALDYVAGLESG